MSSTENYVKHGLILIISKSNLSDKIVSVLLLYGCISWTQMKCGEKARWESHAVLKRSKKQHPTKQQLWGHLPHISQTIKIRWTRHAGHYWKSKDELISDILSWTLAHEHTCVGWPAMTYIHQLCVNTGWHQDELPRVMANRDRCWVSVKGICVIDMLWW